MNSDDLIIQGVEALHDDAVVELRALKGRNRTASGYYTDRKKLALDARLLEKKGYTLYSTLQNINPALLARYTNRFEENPAATASDGDVLAYIWLLIDADPVRPAYVSSTDGEKAAAWKRVEEIRAHLHGFGWPEGIFADSGNDYHLLYKIALPVNPENRELVKSVLEALAFKFDDERVKIDTSVHNPSRICNLYGTTSGKGDGT